MRLLQKVKDGGEQSTVDAYVLIEIKSLFSIMLLKFNKGSRENYHSHAFNAFTWFLKGSIIEHDKDGETYKYTRKLLPKFTHKDKFHRVVANKTSWCLTIRGRWKDEWMEWNPYSGQYTILTHGRKELENKV